MQLKKAYLLIVSVVFTLSHIQAQKLTGTWEGALDTDEFLQINIIQTGDKLCGYTYDYALRDKGSYCRAYFSGTKDENNIWYLDGTSFMENSGNHVLMQLKFKVFYEGGNPILKGYCRIKPSFLSAGGSSMPIRLEKVSEQPARITQAMRDCVAENNPPEPTVVAPPPVTKKPGLFAPRETTPVPPKKVVAIPNKVIKPANKRIPPPSAKPKTILPPKAAVHKKPVVSPPSVAKPPVAVKTLPVPKKDSVPVIKPQIIPLPTETSGRKNKEIGHIIVHDKKITLNVYDNGTVDGDSVSIFYNGRLIMNHKRLSEKPITIDLVLDENTTLHSIVLYAENLGSIPPNTALVVFTTPAGKRYELFSSATLQQNAEIVFEYVPKND